VGFLFLHTTQNINNYGTHTRQQEAYRKARRVSKALLHKISTRGPKNTAWLPSSI